MAVPGTDLRSIPDSSPIDPLMDMEAVAATGGESSQEGAVTPEITALVSQIGPEVATQVLQMVAENPQMVEMMMGGGAGPGGPGGAPMAPPAMSGALSGLEV